MATGNAVTALMGVFSGAGLASTYPGGLFLGQAPENTPLPCLVLVHQGDVPEYTTEAGARHELRVQFLGYVRGAAAALDAADALHAAYDEVLPALAGGSWERTERTRFTVQAEDERDAGGELVYRTESDYRIVYEKG